jgi:predicted acyltransferase
MEAETRAAAPGRLVSLDAFRGFTMFWIVGGAELVRGLEHLGQNPVVALLADQLRHSDWEGLRFYDLIWPSFMLMTGMSLPFSYAKRIQTQSHEEIFLRVLRRFAVLFLLGSVRESVHLGAPYLIELSSALQPIAVAYLFAFLLIRRSAWFQAAVGAGILAGYALVLALVPAPGTPAGSYARGANLVLAVDLAVLGRSLEEGWGTVLSTIPVLSTTILGLLFGRLLMSGLSPGRKCAVIGLTGAGALALGWTLSGVIPIIMKLWTTSYGLVSAGWACLMFLLFYWIIDVRGARRWAFFFVVIGMNALAVYMGRTLVPLKRHVDIFTAGIAAAAGVWGPLLQYGAFLAVEWLILYWMYKRRIFLTA